MAKKKASVGRVIAALRREEAKRLKRQREELGPKIDEFLRERRESSGGWAPVTVKDVSLLYGLLEDLVSLKWGADADGDRPIEIGIVNRNVEERLQFYPLPYWRDAGTEFEQRRTLQVALSNLATATKQFERTLMLFEMEERDRRKKFEEEERRVANRVAEKPAESEDRGGAEKAGGAAAPGAGGSVAPRRKRGQPSGGLRGLAGAGS